MTDALHLLVVAQEFPYPPNHGGRADVWRRLCALKELGCRVALVCWYNDDEARRPTSASIEAVAATVDRLECFAIRRGLVSDVLRLARVAAGLPSHVASRILGLGERRRVEDLVRSFCPQAVLLDSPYGGHAALSVAQQFALPLFYRSHNIEHRYFRGQAGAAATLRDRLAWTFACLGLEKFERSVLGHARHYFDISADDLEFWKGQGFSAGSWLPPLTERRDRETREVADVSRQVADCGFLGNLNAPNNVQGLRWLVTEVMPLVWRERPDFTLAIGGSSPLPEVLALVATDARLSLHQDVPNARRFLESVTVLVNPVLTGSGVNVKTLDMLATDRPIVSTIQGVAGLPASLRSLCGVGQTPAEVGSLLVAALERPFVDLAARVAGRRLYSVDTVAAMVSMIRRSLPLTDSSGQPAHSGAVV
jgi:hypothetical protein